VATPAAVRVWGSSFALYRRIWRSNLLGSLVQPVLYLLGMGVGVGSLVDRGGPEDVLGGVDYLTFLAPSLLATTAMIVVTQEAMWPVMDGFSWGSQYRAMAATPLEPANIVNGVSMWQATRGLIAASGVAIVLVVLPDTRSWGLVPAVLFAVLTGMAFAGPVMAWAATREGSDQSFSAISRFAIVPMFLFAGAFYPVTELPGWLQIVARCTPLYHGVALCRGAVLDTLGVAEAVGHVAVLLGFWLVGLTISLVVFARRLAT